MNSVFELLDVDAKLPVTAEIFRRIFSIDAVDARCICPEALSRKYNVARDGYQQVLTVTNRVVREQAIFNELRTRKPKTFLSTAKPHADYDPTTPAKPCDFCAWSDLTAEDEFGRYETELVVTASNLFKYCGTHGLVLFKHHDPLHFTLRHVAEAMLASAEWFRRGHALKPEHHYPLLVWNCLPRAGASQFHGHLQVLLSGEPFPAMDNFLDACARYGASFAGEGYVADLLHAYDSIGLLRGVRMSTGAAATTGGGGAPVGASRLSAARTEASKLLDTAAGSLNNLTARGDSARAMAGSSSPGDGGSRVAGGGMGAEGGGALSGAGTVPAWQILCGDDPATNNSLTRAGAPFSYNEREAFCFASITPIKDMEVLVIGSSLESPAVHVLLHAVLRALIDDLGVQTFNVASGIGIELTAGGNDLSVGGKSTLSSSEKLTTTRDSIAPPAGVPHAPKINSALRPSTGNAISDSVESFGFAGAKASMLGSSNEVLPSSGLGGYGISPWGPSGPVVLRVASRGSMSVQSSDIGALELFAGSAIGHTDPYTVIRAIDQQLRRPSS